MNTIDIIEGYASNLEFEAKQNARYQNAYENELNRLRGGNTGGNEERLLNIERRLSLLEDKVNDLCSNIIANNSNGLFVFVDNANVKSRICYALSDEQFQEIVSKLMR